MNPLVVLILGASAILIWGTGAYFFWRIDRSAKARRAAEGPHPALKLADRWIAESQRRIQDLIEASEAPLSAAQNELLELRLEASRLPQGVKGLGEVREALTLPLSPRSPGRDLAGTAALYLGPDQFEAQGPGKVVLKTPLGEVPLLGTQGKGTTEERMKALLPQMDHLDSGAAGAFLYFDETQRYRECLDNGEWMEGLRKRRVMPLDLAGLTALLTALRLSRDVEGMVGAFEEGVKATEAIAGRSERMGEALSDLNARVLKLRAVMEGAIPEDLGPKA